MSAAEVTRAGDRDEGRLDAMAQPCRDCVVGEPHVCPKMPREEAQDGDRDQPATEPKREWQPCAVWAALNCLCRSGLNSRAATCTRKREAGR